MKQSFWKKLSKVRFSDLLHILLFFIALPISFFYKRKRPNLWLFCEYQMDACDNAFHLFRYVCEHHPEQDVVYAINKKSKDFDRVSRLGEVVPYGSLKHWILYLSATKNISSQKGGKPNAAVCYLLEVKFRLLKNVRIFLQHGITKDNATFLHYPDTYFSLFVCAATAEYEFISQQFGYPTGIVQNLGFCRFDNLLTDSIDKGFILFMPTWRENLSHLSDEAFQDTDFYKDWQRLLESEYLKELAQQFQLKFLFHPHRNLQHHLHLFHSSYCNISSWDAYDVQQLLKRAKLLVTDYSSVAMDFAYMKKPLLYYQFDYESYRLNHLSEGYFNYKEHGFGAVCDSPIILEAEINLLVTSEFRMNELYLNRRNQFFAYYDTNNCERNYNAIAQLGKEDTCPKI